MPTTSKRPRVLVIGDAVVPTGFARVIHEILRPLVDQYEFHQIGTNFYGAPHDWPWKIYPAGVREYNLGTGRIAPLLQSLKPSIVFMLNDPWVLADYLEVLRKYDNLKTVAYCSINASPIEPEVLGKLQGCDRFVVYTDFARQAVLEGLSRAGTPFDFPAVDVIPHGVDTATFHPLDADRDRAVRMARERIFAGHPDLLDSFIVLNANRNQPRKRIDVTMEGFALFAADKPPGVFLHLHMGSPDIGWDLRKLGRRLGIDEHLILTNENASIPAVSNEELNVIFNAADVGINTASSEGWGLVSFEHAAAGVAQIVPAHTSGLELWQGSAELLEPVLQLVNPQTFITEHLIDPKTVTRTLELLYTQPQHRRSLDAKALAIATQARYRWNNIASEWNQLFRDMLL